MVSPKPTSANEHNKPINTTAPIFLQSITPLSDNMTESYITLFLIQSSLTHPIKAQNIIQIDNDGTDDLPSSTSKY